MNWWFVLLFFVAVTLGFLQIPLWISLIVIVSFSIFIFMMNPLLFGKDADKMMDYLRKSKHPYYKFLYHFLQGNLEVAEKSIDRISKRYKDISKVMLFAKQERNEEAIALLENMKDNGYKWYYRSAIALQENDLKTYEINKSKIKDPVLHTWLEVEEKRLAGKVQDAIQMIDEQIPKLKGIKLLSAVYYREELNQEID
jgi:hypothetical protein